jgi:antitoxin (DNA-binding transcriptional repressor) of toxin-antitoxin stability system
MARSVSIRELRNSTSSVVSELEAGERLTLTVNRRPVADILPHVEDRDPWVPASELRRIPTPLSSSPRRRDASWAISPRRSRSR